MEICRDVGRFGVVIKLGEGWRRVGFNDSYRVVGGWWRNLEFGGWKVNYFEDGGWRMKVKNKIMKFFL